MTTAESLPPVAPGPMQSFGMTVGAVFEAGHVVNESAEHRATVFRIPLRVENVLVPHIIEILRGGNELVTRMEIEEREILPVLLDQAIGVVGRPAFFVD